MSRRIVGAVRVDRMILISGHGGNYVLANVAQGASVYGLRIAVFRAEAPSA
jgi:creatinine amidohydrolase